MTSKINKKKKISLIILAYPLVLILIGLAVNLLGFGIAPAKIALPSEPIFFALAIGAILLVLNHSWLMTATELIRLQYDIRATPEEWQQSDLDREQVSDKGWIELERHHNAHRNATENVIYFVLLALVTSMISPSLLAMQVWVIGFGLARLGYTYCYLKGFSGARGIFMSLTLLCIYGLASYLAISMLR